MLSPWPNQLFEPNGHVPRATVCIAASPALPEIHKFFGNVCEYNKRNYYIPRKQIFASADLRVVADSDCLGPIKPTHFFFFWGKSPFDPELLAEFEFPL